MNKGLMIYEAISGDTTYSLQIHQKRPVCPTCDNAFIVLSEYLQPFMFTRDASTEEITTFTIKDENDTVIETIGNEKIRIVNAGSIDYIYCLFDTIDTDPIPCGLYYYELTFTSNTYYSELFRVIDKDLEIATDNLVTNGDFATDLTGWTVTGATWDASGAQLDSGNSIAQTTTGTGLVKITITIVLANTDTIFSYGYNRFTLSTGANIFYIPSGTLFTIENTGGATFYVESVAIYQVKSVECYNLLLTRSSCNRSDIPYYETGYTDVFILDGELSEPTYPRTDDTVENYRKDNKNTFIKIDKVHELSLSNIIYEPLLDELQKIPAADVIYIFNDVWKKQFSTDEGTLDISVESEYPNEDKCNAEVKLLIVENLISATSCCDTIEGLECCDEFGFEMDTSGLPAVVLDITEPLCVEGTAYYLDTYDGADLIDTDALTLTDGTYTIAFVEGIGLTYKVRGTKFGCPDVEYDLNIS